MAALRVRFDDPENGWINLSIRGDSLDFQQSFSYAGYDSFFDLVTALSLRFAGDGESVVTWLVGAPEFDFRFHRAGAVVTLGIEERPRGISLRVAGSVEEILVPFWRGLRDLESRFSPVELERRWHQPFPSDALRRLTDRINSRK